VWKLLGDENLAKAAEDIICSIGATVERFAETQTEEQSKERKETLGII
jgi:hypothetical protein